MRIATASSQARFAVVLLLCCALCPAGAFATPVTAAIQAKQAEADAARAELERMNALLEIQIEEYNAITEAIDQTRVRIAESRADLERAERDLAAAEDTLARRAASIYRDGGIGVLEVFIGARSFADFVTRIDLAVRISRSDADMVSSVKDARTRIDAAARLLEQRQAEQLALQATARVRAEEIEVGIAGQERWIASIDDEVRQLIAEEEERQRVLAEQRAREAAARAAEAARAAQARGGAVVREATDPGDLSAGHPEVVPIALRYLGVPYVWGGTTPSGFDCSGLCVYVYREIGIELPRVSRSQFRVGQHIPPDRLDLLRPGDLVFFGTDGDPELVHHVGIYVGDGDYVHAPQFNDVVKVSSLIDRIALRGDYVGASRL